MKGDDGSEGEELVRSSLAYAPYCLERLVPESAARAGDSPF